MRVGSLGERLSEGEPAELTVQTAAKGSKAYRRLCVRPVKQRLAEDKVNLTLANQANLWPKSHTVIRSFTSKSVVRPVGIEPTTPAFGGQYSIH